MRPHRFVWYKRILEFVKLLHWQIFGIYCTAVGCFMTVIITLRFNLTDIINLPSWGYSMGGFSFSLVAQSSHKHASHCYFALYCNFLRFPEWLSATTSGCELLAFNQRWVYVCGRRQGSRLVSEHSAICITTASPFTQNMQYLTAASRCRGRKLVSLLVLWWVYLFDC